MTHLHLPEAVATVLETVGRATQTDVPKVKDLLEMEGWSGIGVGHVHLAEGETVEHGAPVVAHVVQCRPFPVATAVSEIRKKSALTHLKPMRKRHFCHSMSWPVTLKLTPSGCVTCSGLRSVRTVTPLSDGS